MRKRNNPIANASGREKLAPGVVNPVPVTDIEKKQKHMGRKGPKSRAISGSK